MLGPGVDPCCCTLAATPISGGWRGIARTRNSVWAKSPVRYHVEPATAARVTTMMIAAGTASSSGYRRHRSSDGRHGSSATMIRATRSPPSAVSEPSAVRTAIVPSAEHDSHHWHGIDVATG